MHASERQPRLVIAVAQPHLPHTSDYSIHNCKYSSHFAKTIHKAAKLYGISAGVAFGYHRGTSSDRLLQDEVATRCSLPSDRRVWGARLLVTMPSSLHISSSASIWHLHLSVAFRFIIPPRFLFPRERGGHEVPLHGTYSKGCDFSLLWGRCEFLHSRGPAASS